MNINRSHDVDNPFERPQAAHRMTASSPRTSGGGQVTDVPPLDRERREYISEDEENRYAIVLRYNRLA